MNTDIKKAIVFGAFSFVGSIIAKNIYDAYISRNGGENDI